MADACVLRLSRVTVRGVLRIALLLAVSADTTLGVGSGQCTFPASWTGSWFQSGILTLLAVNSTHIQTKGECHDTEAHDKFLLYDKSDDCYRCMVIHEKHESVLQYKETYCSPKDSLSSICESISGDAPLFSMFRKDPPPVPQPCPFRQAPFTFTYSRGSGDCANPPSKAESCTDDSRLLLRYQACPDVPGTESNVEELVCLATWKEGSTRYLVGMISQVLRRNSIVSDEDVYRCFVYKGTHAGGRMTYNIAQSGDATCNALASPTDGSRTITLTTSDDHHRRCHFPAWITDHHKWFSLDHTHQYHFTQRNATLKITKENGSVDEMRLVCHSILEQPKDKSRVQLVAHVTQGCVSGHRCLTFHRRDTGVVELQQGEGLAELPEQACAGFRGAPFVTLITTALHPMRCPNFGRYSVMSSLADRRRRRQQTGGGSDGGGGETRPAAAECVAGDYDSLQVGCGASHDTMEFKSSCSSTVYTCHGSWSEGPAGFLVAAPVSRASSHPRTYCFLYTHHKHNESRGGAVEYFRLSAVAHSCDRTVAPGITGDKAYNLTINGTCIQSSEYSSRAPRAAPPLLLAASLGALALLRSRRTR